MIRTKILEFETLTVIQNNLLDLLNNSSDFDNIHIINSPRAVGDTVQEVLGNEMIHCFPAGLIKDFDASFARRSMADAAFMD